MKEIKEKIKLAKAKLENENIREPYINNEYICMTCSNIGKSHPITSYCFICDDDNWRALNDEVDYKPVKVYKEIINELLDEDEKTA